MAQRVRKEEFEILVPSREDVGHDHERAIGVSYDGYDSVLDIGSAANVALVGRMPSARAAASNGCQ